LAQRSSFDAYQVLDNARRALRRVPGRAKGRLRRAINELSTTVERARRVVAQTRRRLGGDKPDSATRGNMKCDRIAWHGTGLAARDLGGHVAGIEHVG
jgi:hypothetical protein